MSQVRDDESLEVVMSTGRGLCAEAGTSQRRLKAISDWKLGFMVKAKVIRYALNGPALSWLHRTLYRILWQNIRLLWYRLAQGTIIAEEVGNRSAINQFLVIASNICINLIYQKCPSRNPTKHRQASSLLNYLVLHLDLPKLGFK